MDIRQNNKGKTAPHRAAYGGDLEIVRILVDTYGNISRKDNFGMTPLDILKDRGIREDSIKYMELVKLLQI
jgi:ankyrin repeat protein